MKCRWADLVGAFSDPTDPGDSSNDRAEHYECFLSWITNGGMLLQKNPLVLSESFRILKFEPPEIRII